MAKISRTSTNKALFKNTGIIAIGQISTRLVNFFLLPLYTAILTTEEYGLVDLLTTYSGLIVIIVGLQMSQAAFRFLVTCRDDKEKITQVSSTIALSTVVVMVIYATLFSLIQPFIHVQFKWYLLVHVVVSLFLQTTSCIARGLGKNADYAVGNFLSAVTSLVLNLITIAILRLGVGAMLSAYIIGPIVGGTFLLLKSGAFHFIRFSKADKNEFKTIINYSLPLIPNELSWNVIHASDRMVVSHILGVAINGLIAVAARFSAIYTTFFSIFNTSWTEQVVLHYKDEGGPEYINDMFDKMVSFFGCVAIGIIASMPFVFRILVNIQFADAYNLVPLYMIATFFNAVIGMVSAVYLIENETKQVAVTTMGAALINLLVDIVFIKYIGMYAAPVSSICGYALMSFWRLYDVNKRHCKIGMPIKKVIILLFALVISLIGFYSNSKLIGAITLIVIAALSFFINRVFITTIVSMLKKKL